MSTIRTKLQINKGSNATILTRGIQGPQGERGLDGSSNGWIQYSDSQYTLENPLELQAGQRTILTNDKSLTINKLDPSYSGHDFWVDEKFNPENLEDVYIFRVNFIAESSITDESITLELDIAGDQGVIYSETQDFDKNAGASKQISFNLTFYALSTFLANKGSLYVSSNSDSFIHDIVFLIIPIYRKNN